MQPLAIDLFCGLGGWAEGFLAEGYRVIGFDIERHDYGTGGYPGQLVIQDVLTLHGAQFRNAACIVASPPCQKYSYMAMPWSKAKALIRYYEDRREELNALFNACFRIQQEANEAAGRYIPLVVENVRGAQKWIGRAAQHWGSYYLWGDVPAILPIRCVKTIGHTHRRKGHAHTRHLTNSAEYVKVHGIDFSGPKAVGFNVTAAQRYREGVKGFDREANGRGNLGKNRLGRAYSSRSDSRRAASALIAKIPFPLAQHIAKCFRV